MEDLSNTEYPQMETSQIGRENQMGNGSRVNFSTTVVKNALCKSHKHMKCVSKFANNINTGGRQIGKEEETSFNLVWLDFFRKLKEMEMTNFFPS